MPTSSARPPPREDCVICFDTLDSAASANPCLHDSYHSHCLLKWLELNPSCPLCKTPVTHVTAGPSLRTIYTVPAKPPAARADPLSLWGRPANLPLPARRRPRRRQNQPPAPAATLESFPRYRLDVYRHSRFSLHVGSNPHTGYRPLTPATLHDPSHLSRARAFIRRELLVLDALDPDLPRPEGLLPRGAAASPQRSRAFRLEYIVAVLKAAGPHGSSGAGEELLERYLGRHTRLFLHELRSFLRSPFGRVEAWDREVGYAPLVVGR
ncbi:uncharacterized protein DNG_07138 [Cephalotrichum gorgonifer]|uniref:RING-type E3 ubiquitin transferase n=1 Tax=Cephalotrichum gorgonifer TaxID=2041049 RepID=A0AAE8SX67_9PEZI|nr:uncharacterized protein DNG_07138 [Cephalotrichum gorgonifer]